MYCGSLCLKNWSIKICAIKHSVVVLAVFLKKPVNTTVFEQLFYYTEFKYKFATLQIKSG